MRHLCKWTTLAEHQWTTNGRQLTDLSSDSVPPSPPKCKSLVLGSSWQATANCLQSVRSLDSSQALLIGDKRERKLS